MPACNNFTFSASEFWQFACAEYAKDRRYPFNGDDYHLLELQDQHGKNVNLCLLMLYLDTLALEITLDDIACLAQTAAPLQQQALIPLRNLRQTLKQQQTELTDYPQIRQALLDAELLLEKQQQQQLINKLNQLSLMPNKHANNLAQYLYFAEKLT